MSSQNSDRENVRCIEYLRGHIGAKVTDHFPASPFLPLSRIIVSFIHPILEFLIQLLTSLDAFDASGSVFSNVIARSPTASFVRLACSSEGRTGHRRRSNLLLETREPCFHLNEIASPAFRRARNDMEWQR